MLKDEKVLEIIKSLSFERLGGSKNEKQAFSIISKELAQIKVEYLNEPFDMVTYSPKTAELKILSPYKKIISCEIIGFSGSTAETGIDAEIMILETIEFKKLHHLKNKIVLALCNLNVDEYRNICDSQPAAIIRVTSPGQGVKKHGRLWPHVALSDNNIPSVYISYDEACSIIKNNAEKAWINIHQEVKLSQSQNLIVKIEGAGSKAPIIMGAHVDTILGSTGVCDNASSAALLVYLADALSNNWKGPPIELIWFGSEELGLIGSTKYIKRHKNRLEKIGLMMNIDSIGGIISKHEINVFGDDHLLNFINNFSRNYNVNIVVKNNLGSGDELPFNMLKIPTLSFYRNSFHIHTPNDSLEFIDHLRVIETGKIIIDILSKYNKWNQKVVLSEALAKTAKEKLNQMGAINN